MIYLFDLKLNLLEYIPAHAIRKFRFVFFKSVPYFTKLSLLTFNFHQLFNIGEFQRDPQQNAVHIANPLLEKMLMKSGHRINTRASRGNKKIFNFANSIKILIKVLQNIYCLYFLNKTKIR